MAIPRRPALENARRAFGDTSYFFALLNNWEPDHPRALEISDELRERSVQVVTTWEIVFETVALLRYRSTFETAAVFLTQILPQVGVLTIDGDERQRSIDLFLKQGRGRRLSLCDATSYVVVSGRLQWIPCLSFDYDFIALGLTVVR